MSDYWDYFYGKHDIDYSKSPRTEAQQEYDKQYQEWNSREIPCSDCGTITPARKIWYNCKEYTDWFSCGGFFTDPNTFPRKLCYNCYFKNMNAIDKKRELKRGWYNRHAMEVIDKITEVDV